MVDKIEEVVCAAIGDFNGESSESKQLAKDTTTALYGSSAVLDSLDLVNLIVLVEERVRREMNVSVSLADERALSQKNSPFRTVGTLCDYIRTLISESV
jgi:acyl carrier protein